MSKCNMKIANTKSNIRWGNYAGIVGHESKTWNFHYSNFYISRLQHLVKLLARSNSTLEVCATTWPRFYYWKGQQMLNEMTSLVCILSPPLPQTTSKTDLVLFTSLWLGPHLFGLTSKHYFILLHLRWLYLNPETIHFSAKSRSNSIYYN